MKTNLFPTGESWEIIGSKPLNDIFGIVKCKVTIPIAKDLYAPILMTKDNRGHTIAPTGS